MTASATSGVRARTTRAGGHGAGDRVGDVDDDMVTWTVTLLNHTETLRSETDNRTFVSIRGANPELLFTDEELKHVDMPVLLLWGDEHTNGGALEAGALAAWLSDPTLEMVYRAGHAPWIDELGFCVAQTGAFLQAPQW